MPGPAASIAGSIERERGNLESVSFAGERSDLALERREAFGKRVSILPQARELEFTFAQQVAPVHRVRIPFRVGSDVTGNTTRGGLEPGPHRREGEGGVRP